MSGVTMEEVILAKDASLGTIYLNTKKTTQVVARAWNTDGWLVLLNCFTDTEVSVPPSYRLYPVPLEAQVVIQAADQIEAPQAEEPVAPSGPLPEEAPRKKLKGRRKNLSSKDAFRKEITTFIRKSGKSSFDELYDLLEGHFDGDDRRKLNARLVMELGEMLMDGILEEHEDGSYTLEEASSED